MHHQPATAYKRLDVLPGQLLPGDRAAHVEQMPQVTWNYVVTAYARAALPVRWGMLWGV